MFSISNIIFYILVFLSVYIQVFFLVTFLENRKNIIIRKNKIKLLQYPAVTIIVPCFNEEKTVYKTVSSLLELNYPKDKVKILLIDDGSTDSTWNIISKFTTFPNIKVFKKENGGKHTALNLGLANTETDFVGCLDADSLVDKESLIRIISYFEKDPNTMAVVPSIIVHQPKTIIQKAQAFEHFMTVFMRKIHSFLGAVSVLPGPFSIYKKKVFDDLGLYRQAYNVEDTEMAYRMQKNHYKIDDCHDAYVYTNMPGTIPKLYKQRLRWIYGVINNIIDYRGVLFNKKYGNFSILVVPAALIFMFSSIFMFSKEIYYLIHFLFLKILNFQAVGFHVFSQAYNFDSFFIPTQVSLFIIIFIYSVVILLSTLGRKIVEDKWVLSFDVVYFLIIFSVVGPFWLLKAIYNTLLRKVPVWR